MFRRARLWGVSFGVVSVVAAPGCSPDGDGLVPVEEQAPNPCQSSEADLSDGLQTGSELRVVFDCINRSGQFDPFVPLMDAMETQTISDGQTTVLDMWVEVLNSELDKAKGSDTSVSTADLLDALDQSLEVLSENWLPDAVEILGQFLDSGAVEPAIPMMGSIATELLALQDPTQEVDPYQAYLDQLVQVLCPDLETQGQCVGDVQQLYRTMVDIAATYGQPDYPGSSGQQLTETLAGLFAPKGDDESENNDLDRALGRGIARLGAGTFLLDTMNIYVPALYGDDPNTPELEGYDSYNANKSALYGIMSLLGDPEYAASVKDELNNLSPLLNSYYTWSILVGYDTDIRKESCDPAGTGVFTEDNPANYGLDQILRLLKEADVDYRDAPSADCSTYIGYISEAAQALYFELSGSTNIAVLMLELFGQLSPEAVAASVDAGGVYGPLIEDFNTACGTQIVLDDYEALQESVHIEEVIAPTLKLLAAITHAGAMEKTKDMLVALYDTHMLCEAQPWLEAALGADNVLAQYSGTVSPFAPGQPYHDTVTAPMLRTVARLRGTPANTLIPPLAAGLQSQGKNLGDVLTGLGRMADDAVTEYEYLGDPAMYHIDEIMANLRSLDTDYKGIEGMAKSVQEQTVLTAMLETIAVPEVQDAFDTTYPAGGRTAVQFMADFANEGQLLDLLYMARNLLEQLDTEVQKTPTGASAN